MKRYRNLIGLLCMIIMAVALYNVGVPGPVCFSLVACYQIWQFAMSRKPGYCFTTALTPEQVQEFERLLNGFKGYDAMFKDLQDLSKVEGGFAAVKKLPELLKAEQKRNDELSAELGKLRKQALSLRAGQAARAGHVSEECARALGAVALMRGLRSGLVAGAMKDAAEGIIKDALQVEAKTALTTSDIPLPTIYSGEVAELVSQYGAARKYGTVFPLGSGSVKLPRLKTDTAFGLLQIATGITEKSPTFEWVTFTSEKTGGLIILPSEIEEDSVVAMGQFLARYASRQMAKAEDTLFWVGDGTTQGDPEGLAYSVITNGKVTQLGSGKTKYSDPTLTNVRSIRALVDAAALGTSAYYMHPSFEQMLSGFNTGGDKPYIANGINGASLDGFPIRWVDVMPAYSTGANAAKVFMLFGDPTWQYLGVRGGMRFDISDQVGFASDVLYVRALERFTIGLMATGAMSGLETAAA